MSALADPSLPGPCGFDAALYASAGVNYSAVPVLSQYHLYDRPDADYATKPFDLSAFAEVGLGAPWPFRGNAVPRNGHLRIPRGRGPFPLVVFAHGNHEPTENSTPGYLYLCEMLASQGIVAATIDVNFLNGDNYGEIDGRAIVHLEHLKQIRGWDARPGHPLCGKVNWDRVMIVGHSRGGEGVALAACINRLTSLQPDTSRPPVPLDGSAGLGPYRFNLSLVVALAPTDGQYLPSTGPTVVPDDYVLIHGSRDGDVRRFLGYDTYNRAHAVDLANPTASDGKFKALLWVLRGNHNYFNSTWAAERPRDPTLTRAEQEQVARVQFGALAAAVLHDRDEYRAVLRDHTAAAAWMPAGTAFVSQYQDPQRVFLLHNQEGIGFPQVSSPSQGSVTAAGVAVERQRFDLAQSGGPQQTVTLRLGWTTAGARLQLEIDPATLPAGGYNVLALRVGQSVEGGNTPGREQDFSLEMASGNGTASIPASSLQRLLYPDVYREAGKTVMQTLRLPVQRLRALGIDPCDLRRLALVFDRQPTGVVYVGEVQFSN